MNVTPAIESTAQDEPDVPVTGIASAPEKSRAETTAPSSAGQKEKIIVTLDARGGLDLDSMRDKTKDKLLEALRKSGSGLLPASSLPPVKRWPDVAIRGGYAVLGVAEVAIANRKYPPELAKIFLYDDADMDILMEPTQAALARYAGSISHEELIALGMALVQVHVQKLHLVNQAMTEYTARMAKEKAEVKTPGPSPEDTTKPVVPEGIPGLD